MSSIAECRGCRCLIPPGEETAITINGRTVAYVHKGATRSYCRIRALEAVWRAKPDVVVTIQGIGTFLPADNGPVMLPTSSRVVAADRSSLASPQ